MDREDDITALNNTAPLLVNQGGAAVPAGEVIGPGMLIADRYRVIALIGQGGMGTVYRVEQVFLKQEFALKTVPVDIDETSRRRFLKEAKNAASLDHPNLIKVCDCGFTATGQPFFVMDLAEGETLLAIIKRTGGLSLSAVIPLFKQICLGLAYSHDQGIVHRDIKPSNIMVTNVDNPAALRVKVLDFGIAKALGFQSPDSTELTRTGQVFGTPYYMSPEQCAGRADNRSDVYSVGCVLFETLTGLPPFIGDTALATMMKHQTESPPSLKEASLGKEFPADLELVIKRLLDKDPSLRYPHLRALAEDLDRIGRGETVWLGRTGLSGGYRQSRSAAGVLNLLPWLSLIPAVMIGYATAVATRPSQTVVKFERPQQPSMTSPITDAAEEKVQRPKSYFSSPVPGLQNARFFSFGDLRLGAMRAKHDCRLFCYYKNSFIEAKGEAPLVYSVLVENFHPLDIVVEPELAESPELFDCFRVDEVAGLDFSKAASADDDLLKRVERFSNLRSLNLDLQSRITSGAFDSINKYPYLTDLHLSKGNFDTREILRLKRLTDLQRIQLSHLNDIQPVLKALVANKNLVRLSLRHCKIDHQSVQDIAKIRSLDELDFTDTNIVDEDLKCLTALPNLAQLNVAACPRLTLKCVPIISRLKAPSVTLSKRYAAALRSLSPEKKVESGDDQPVADSAVREVLRGLGNEAEPVNGDR